MKCAKVHSLLDNYIDKKLPDKQYSEIKSHLEDCLECSQVYSKVLKILDLLKPNSLVQDQAFYYTRLKQKLDNKIETKSSFFESIFSRKILQPVAYLTGQQEFWSLTLQVTPATLIPRPETEVLVEQALSRIPLNQQLTLMDLGTGSGAIALAIAGQRPQCSVIAIDNVAETLMIARHNAHQLGIQNIQFVLSDWFSAIATVPVDLIVSNPPYIATQDPHLHDIRYEPQWALIAGNDGLQALRHIISRAPAYLTSQGWLLVEHGYQQAQAVQTLFKQRGYTSITTYLDLAQNPRVTGGQYKGT